jgi:penicillin V acylase-like amidase (Ntn superfamily)
MAEQGEIVNTETVQWALKAASTTANVKSAIEVLKVMKMSEIQPTKEIYNSLIRVYAKACDMQ